jgi:lantibiotic biosynthesis protein
LAWVLVRAPLLPVDAYLGLRQESESTERPRAGTLIPETLQRFLAGDPRIAAAVAVGSASLFDALERSGLNGEDGKRCCAKLLRYLIRMSTRPTPFGLFAGVGIARWGDQTNLRIASARPRTRTRPDMGWLLRFVFQLESRRDIRIQLRYRANPRAVARAGRIVLRAPDPTADGPGPGPAVSVRAAQVVTTALDLARTPISHECLVAGLAVVPGVTREKAETLVEELWRRTLLLTDLRPPLTETSPAEYVVRRLEGISAAAAARDQLTGLLAAMAAWDELTLGEAAAGYRALVQLSDEGENVTAAAPQVDMALPLGGRDITRAVAGEAVRAAELLLRLTPLPAGLPHLAAYRKKFEARYGRDREVPLLELLNPDFGLGPPSVYSPDGQTGLDPRLAELRNQALHHLAVSAFWDRRLVVDLDDETIAKLETCWPTPQNAPVSMDLSAFVVARSAADLDIGQFHLVIGANLGARAAGRNLGRFVGLLGDQALAGLHDVASAELAHNPDGLWTELVYLPAQLRAANVAVRAHPRRYEIVLGTTPGVEPERVIPPAELVVGICDDRFYIRWPRRGAEVVPCVAHMLNNVVAPDVIRFLDDLRQEGLAQLSSFDWGPASSLPVLPRVQAGRVILSLARWRIDSRVREELSPSSPTDFPSRLASWRERWQVPRYVYLRYADNRLLLDLEDHAQAGELRAELHRLKDGNQIVLEEAFPGPDGAWTPGPGGRFLTEIVVPLVLRPPGSLPRRSGSRQMRSASPRDRIRAPGSDWLFAKLYGPRALEDDLLTGPVPELCGHALASGAAEDWFFIRYADPDPHLRLRFRGRPDRLIGELAPQLCSWAENLISQDLCYRLCLDTYEREVERYGGPQGISLAESIFGADSRFVVQALQLIRSGALSLDMTALAVLSIDHLLAGMGADPAQRLNCYHTWVQQRNASGAQYRQRQAALRALLGEPQHLRQLPGGEALARVLAVRRREISASARRLNELARTGELSQSASALFRSCVHLHRNRLVGIGGPDEDRIIGLLQRTRHGLSLWGTKTGHR